MEVKRRFDTDVAWAEAFRANLLEHAPELQALPLLLATPDRGYFWERGEARTHPAIVDLRTELGSFFERVGVAPSAITPMAFEALVGAWLDEALTTGDAPDELGALLRATRGGVVRVGDRA